MYPLGVPDKEASVAQTQQQAQQQPARRLNRATSQENMRRKPSTRHGASGSGSRGGGGGGGSGVPAPAPPIPAMHAQAPPTPQTLIQLEDRRPFAKGSLLDAATSSSNDILPSAASLTRSKSAVTRRKPSTTHPQHDVPLPNTQPIMVSANGPSTLLQLDNTRERHHTKTLLQRQMKPLLNFDSKAP
ncbi:hypothetical protein BC940DRAFT_51322 [Gongronella butleri]|nr:hypothetical protein BC940DRAFT_51322 [Gongronella butleri]